MGCSGENCFLISFLVIIRLVWTNDVNHVYVAFLELEYNALVWTNDVNHVYVAFLELEYNAYFW